VSYIKAKNCDEVFNKEIEDGQVTHSMLSLAIAGVQSQEALGKCSSFEDVDFIDNT